MTCDIFHLNVCSAAKNHSKIQKNLKAMYTTTGMLCIGCVKLVECTTNRNMLGQVSECQNLIINIISYRLSFVFSSKDLKLRTNFLHET